MFSVRSNLALLSPGGSERRRRLAANSAANAASADGAGGPGSPRGTPGSGRDRHNHGGRFCCKSRCKCSKPEKGRAQSMVVSSRARKGEGPAPRLRAGRVLDALLGEAGLGRAVQLLVLRGGVAGGLRVLLALRHEARQRGAREFLLG